MLKQLDEPKNDTAIAMKEPGVPVYRTGQTKCWDTSGREVASRGSGQDGEYQHGVMWPEPRFDDSSDGSVLDRLTGLTWLRDADAFGELNWEESLKKANELCDGHSDLKDGSAKGDWRMPNIRELLSIIDYGAVDPIIPSGHPFQNVKSAIYWTSTTLLPAPYLAWMMTLGIGPTVFDLKVSSARVWPVRGSGAVAKTGQQFCFDGAGKPVASCQGTGQDGDKQAGKAAPEPRFTPNNDGTATDEMTGLVWLESGNSFGMRTWAQSIELCNFLKSGEHGLADGSVEGDWRLPNVREMESLIDYNNAGPCLPKGHPFVDVRPSSYWTSTSVTSAPTEAMFVILGVGPSIFENKEHPFFLWPVRDRRL